MRLLADLEEADGAFLDKAPKGLLRVNAQGTLARYFVMPGLPGFLARYPDITLHLGEDDRYVDLVREGVDCVLRAGELQDSSLAGRRIALMPQVTVASPAYLARHGEPAGLEDLDAHWAVNYQSSATGRAMTMDFLVDGRSVRRARGQRERGRAVHGRGAGRAGIDPGAALPRGAGAGGRPAQGRVPHLPPAPMPVSVLYPQNRQVSARVRVFTQWLAQRFEAAFGADMPVR